MRRVGMAIGLLLLAAPAFAEHPGGGTSVNVAGVTLTCPTAAGGMVWWVVSPPGGPTGRHQSRGGVSWTPLASPHIFLKTDVFGNLPAAVQLFIALHECAHFHLPAHLNTELNADCWTVRTVLANRWMTEADLEFVRRKLAVSREVADWGHPGGGIHVENIAKCLSGR